MVRQYLIGFGHSGHGPLFNYKTEDFDMWTPDPSDSDFIQWVKMFVFAAFAAIGGFLSHLVRSFETNASFSWAKSIVAFLASGFVGILMVLVCRALKLDDTWTGLVAGTAGWLGADVTIQIVAKFVRRKLGIPDDIGKQS